MAISKKSIAVINIILVMIIWGSSFTITRSMVTNFPPIYLAFLRYSVASLLLLILLFIQRKKIGATLRLPWRPIIAMGLSGISFYYIFFNISMVYTPASTGALIQGFIPATIALLAAIFLREKLTSRQIAGILISVSGVILIGFISAPASQTKNPVLGSILMIVAVLLWSVYTIISKKMTAIHPLLLTTCLTVIGTVFLLPAVYIESHYYTFPAVSVKDWLGICYLGVFASAICYLLYNSALNYLSAVQVGNFLNLDPVIGAAIALVVLKESISPWQIGGGVLVLIGILLSSEQTKK
jgi:drug/metabolite transporter (DMT)-like permease